MKSPIMFRISNPRFIPYLSTALIVGSLLAALFFIGEAGAKERLTHTSKSHIEDAAAIQMVRGFFSAFDARDGERLDKLFVPTAHIVHHNGVITDIPTMLEIVRSTKNWAPRNGAMSAF